MWWLDTSGWSWWSDREISWDACSSCWCYSCFLCSWLPGSFLLFTPSAALIHIQAHKIHLVSPVWLQTLYLSPSLPPSPFFSALCLQLLLNCSWAPLPSCQFPPLYTPPFLFPLFYPLCQSSLLPLLLLRPFYSPTQHWTEASVCGLTGRVAAGWEGVWGLKAGEEKSKRLQQKPCRGVCVCVWHHGPPGSYWLQRGCLFLFFVWDPADTASDLHLTRLAPVCPLKGQEVVLKVAGPQWSINCLQQLQYVYMPC